jgi:hypothetical protein
MTRPLGRPDSHVTAPPGPRMSARYGGSRLLVVGNARPEPRFCGYRYPTGAGVFRGRDAAQRRNNSTRAGACSWENLHVCTSPHWELLAPVAKLNRHVGHRTSRSSGSFGQKYRPQGANPSPASKSQSHPSHGANPRARSSELTLLTPSCITHLASRSDATTEDAIGLEPKVPTRLALPPTHVARRTNPRAASESRHRKRGADRV